MKKILGTAAVLVTAAGLATAPALTTAADAVPAKAKVSVSLEGNPDPFGELSSRKASCIDNRLVVLWKQVGTRGGGDDVRTGNTDHSASDGSFDFGSPGLRTGKYYATVGGKPGCKRGASPTIRIVRN